MELIKGRNIYECDLSFEDRNKILVSLVEALKQLHASDHVPADSFSMKEAYFNKTMERLSRIRDLVPYADREHITVNAKIMNGTEDTGMPRNPAHGARCWIMNDSTEISALAIFFCGGYP